MNRMHLISPFLVIVCLGAGAAAGSMPRTQAATTPNPAALLRQSIATMRQSVHSSRSTSLVSRSTGRCALTGTRITASWTLGKSFGESSGAEEGLIWSLSPSWATYYLRGPGKPWAFNAYILAYSADGTYVSDANRCSLIWIRQLQLQPPTGLTMAGSATVGEEASWHLRGTEAGAPVDLYIGRQTHLLRRVTTLTSAYGHDDIEYSGFNAPITITLPSVTPSPARAGHVALRLSGGRVLVMGGSPPAKVFTGWMALYDPSTGTWSRVNPPAVPLEADAVALHGGRLLVSGVFYPVLGPGWHIFDSAAHTWRRVPAPSPSGSTRYSVRAVLRDGRVLVAGAVNLANGRSLGGAATLYDPATGTWARTGGVTTDFGWGASSVVMKDGRVLVVDSAAEIFNPARGTWSRVAAPPTGMDISDLWSLPSGRVLAIGTPRGSNGRFATAIFDPAGDTWSPVRRSPVMKWDVQIYGPATALLPTGTLLVSGGGESRAGGFRALSAAWLFDPARGTWTATGSMTVGRIGDTLTLLASGKVLAAGGYKFYSSIRWDKSTYLSSAELYDPATGRWSLTGSMK